MTKQNPANYRLLTTIFITVFIDLLGIGIIIPVIPSIFYEEGSQFFTVDIDAQRKAMYYGILLACYPFMQFFGAPILGALSDRFGRKPVLMVSLIGTLIGYLLFAYSIVSHNLLLLFVSRMIPGFTGGNIAILTSSIADISDKESRTRYFGLIGMAFGIGFILGPTIGGVLSDNTVVPWFDHYVPFLFTAGLALVNFILVYFFFKETLVHKLQTSISPFKGVQNIFTSFSSPNLRAVFTVVFLISVGFTFYTQFFSVYLLEKFDFKEKEIGLLYGYIGVWLAIVQGVLVRYLSYRMPPKRILMGSLPLLALALGLVLLPTSGWMFYVVNPLIAIAYGITSPNVTSIVSSQADETLQGSILGINQSMLSLGQMITPVIGGVLVGINIHYPLIASATIIVLAAVIFYISRSKILYDGKA